jgi:hypothetical protein
VTEPVLYAEQGSSWWPLLWGPLFAGLGAGLEATTGPVHTLPWVGVGVILFGVTAIWVKARRKVYRVELTPRTLRQGMETIDTSTMTQVSDVGAGAGAKPLGGGWTVPRRTDEVPVKLDDGTVVLAWARDGEALKNALVRIVEERPVE